MEGNEGRDMNQVAEAGILRSLGALCQSIKDFLGARTVSTAGIVLFLLLATFLLWPLIAVLMKSVEGSDGFTLQYYKNFITKPYYYQSLV